MVFIYYSTKTPYPDTGILDCCRKISKQTAITLANTFCLLNQYFANFLNNLTNKLNNRPITKQKTKMQKNKPTDLQKTKKSAALLVLAKRQADTLLNV